MKISSPFYLLILAFLLSSCGTSPAPDAAVVTPPAISLNITRGICPSIEVQPGMQIAWTNLDNVDRSLIIERANEQGVVVDSGGTPSLQPGSTFMITLIEEGQYTYYCSIDRKQFGTISVMPNVPVSVSALSTQAAATPQCTENLVPPTIIEIQPVQPLAGSEITVTGSGGFIQDSCGGVNESARSFTLFLDQEPVGDFQCYINRCVLEFRLPDTTAVGSHCLSTQKDVCEFQFMVVVQ